MNKFEIFFPRDFGGFHMKGTEKEISKLICVFACFNINTEILRGIRLSSPTKKIVFEILLEIEQ